MSLSHSHIARMAERVRAVESVVAMPAYREDVLRHSPAVALHDPGGARGVFFGYECHVTEGGFELIEINTNAGDAQRRAGTSATRVLPGGRCPAASAGHRERVRRPDCLDVSYGVVAVWT